MKIVSSQSLISKSTKPIHNWHWRESNKLTYLTCSLFKDWQHGFFTRQFLGKPPSQLVKILNPQAEVYRVKQVHGDRILTPSEITISTDSENNITYSEADSIITENPMQSIWVASADCTPVLIADLKTGRVSAIHSGWRGTAQEIVPKTISRLLAMGSKIENLIFALGPAIAGEVYQFEQKVAAEVGKTIVTSDDNSNLEAILQLLKEIPLSPILEDPMPRKVRLDVRKIIYLQLEKLGVASENIAIAPYCTYQQSDQFFSYRRTKEKKVQWSGIVSKQI